MAPETYWKVWSDAIIHRIHLRVLQHLQRLAEVDSETKIDSSLRSE
jgi:hypothetical protein